MPVAPLHLLLLGGGHANITLLKAARRWTDAGARVTLVSDRRHLFYSGMTPEYLGGVYSPGDVRIDLLRWSLRSHVHFIQSPAVHLDAEQRTVRTAGGDTVTCDVAVVDVGAINSLQDRAGNAVHTKPLHAVDRLHAWLCSVLSCEQPRRSLVIVGGGPAGTEVALNVSARVMRSARPDALQISIVHSDARLMTQFAPNLGHHAEVLLRDRGVNLHLNGRVARVEGDSVHLENGQRLHADQVVWATGPQGHPLFRSSGLPLDEHGFVRVDRALRVQGHPWLFAAGDCAVMDGRQLDRSGVNAVKQGLTLRGHADRLVRAWKAGRNVTTELLPPFRPYPVAPYLVSTGENEALLAFGPRVGLHGRFFLLLKHLADQTWISRYQFPDGLR